MSGSGVYFLRSQVDASEFVAKFAENKQRTEEYGFLMTVVTLVQMSENHVLSEGTQPTPLVAHTYPALTQTSSPAFSATCRRRRRSRKCWPSS